MSAAHFISCARTSKLRYNKLTMQLTTGSVRALSNSINYITANLTVKRSLEMKCAILAVG